MRRLLQSVKTREYFGAGYWTPDPTLAQDFPDAGKAIDTCLKYHLRDVDLVLQLNAEPQDRYDTHLRLFDYGAAA